MQRARDQARPLGILAGGGGMPAAVARSVVARGGRVHIVGIAGEADRSIESFPHDWVNWGGIGHMVGALERAGCRDLVIVGRVARPDLWRIRPDLGFFLNLPKLLRLLKGGDDSVLTKVIRFFEAKGLRVLGAHEAAPDLVAAAGALGRHAAGPEHAADIALGLAAIAALGPFDVGQAVVVADGRIVAVEGAEGTDAMLARVERLRAASTTGASPSGALIKRPKPGQELRIDMPTIGPRTAELAVAAHLRGIAVEAGHVLTADRAALVAAADRSGLFIAGVDTDAAGDGAGERQRRHRRWRWRPPPPAMAQRGRGPTPRARDTIDIAKGVALQAALAPWAVGQVLVVARQHVLVVGAAEPVVGTIARAGELRQWGSGRSRRRRGVAIVGASVPGLGGLATPAAAAGLAGIAIVGEGGPAAIPIRLLREAEAAGLFVAEIAGS